MNGEQRTEDRDAERAGRLSHGIEHARRNPRALLFDRGEQRRRHRRYGQADAERKHENAGQHREVARVRADRHEQDIAHRRDRQPGDHRKPRAARGGQPAGDDVGDAQRYAERKKREPGLQRRVSLRALPK